MSPFSTKVLILGNKHFALPIIDVFKKNNYTYDFINDYSKDINVDNYNAIVIAEHENNKLLIGDNAYISSDDISEDIYIVHICGNVDFDNLRCDVNTNSPAEFGYMSYTTDYIDNQAVIDLHTAGLKVAEGMLIANKLNLNKNEYKSFMENNYPALAFNNERYW